MQYYRLWIYSCNGVLGLSSAVFTVFAAFVLADVRLSLLGGVELYHPTFLYACAALILQSGVLQTIGCLGAQRLSHKLLTVYWILLLLLTIGDVVVGLVWVFKLDKVKQSLRPALSKEFLTKYSTDPIFTRTWNKVQSQERCCGVDGPFDFQTLFQSELAHQQPHSVSHDPNHVFGFETGLLSLPESCCTIIYVPVYSVVDPSALPAPPQKQTPFPISGFGGATFSSVTPTVTASSSPPASNLPTFDTTEKDSVESIATPLGLGTDNHTVENDMGGYTDDGGGGDLSKHLPFLEPMTVPLPLLFATNETNLIVDNLTAAVTANLVNVTFDPTSASTSALAADDQNFVVPSFIPFKQHKRRHTHTHAGSRRNNKHLVSAGSGGSTTSGSLSVTATEGSTTNTENLDFVVVTNSTDTLTSSTQSVVVVENSSTSSDHEKTNDPPSDSSTTTTTSFMNSVDFSGTLQATTTENNAAAEMSADIILPPVICQRHQRHWHHATTSSSSTTTLQSDTTSDTSTELEYLESSTNILNLFEKRREKRNSPTSTTQQPNDYKQFTILTSSSTTTSVPIFPSITADGRTSHLIGSSGEQDDDHYIASGISMNINGVNNLHTDHIKKFLAYTSGCSTKLIAWLDYVSGVLFILGFCIIVFVKTCFLVILRYEIREMISKIHLMETENPVSPTRSTQNKYYQSQINPPRHPLLSNPHRASTVSAGGGYCPTGLPLIKSPEGAMIGQLGRGRPHCGYTSYNRRPSNFERERSHSQSHSQETMNMTLLITNPSIGDNRSSQQHSRTNSNTNSCTHSAVHNPLMEDTSLSIRVPRGRRSSSASVTYTASTTTAGGFCSSLSPQPGPSSRFYHQPFSTTSAGSNSSTSAAGCPTSYNHPPHIKHLGVLNPGTHHGGSGGSGLGGYGCNSSFSSRDENEILSVSMENLEEVGSAAGAAGGGSGGGGGGGGNTTVEEQHEDEDRREQEIRNWVAVAGNSTSDSLHDNNKAGGYGASRSHQNNSSVSSGGSNERQRRNGNNNVDCNSIPLSFLGTAV